MSSRAIPYPVLLLPWLAAAGAGTYLLWPELHRPGWIAPSFPSAPPTRSDTRPVIVAPVKPVVLPWKPVIVPPVPVTEAPKVVAPAKLIAPPEPAVSPAPATAAPKTTPRVKRRTASPRSNLRPPTPKREEVRSPDLRPPEPRPPTPRRDEQVAPPPRSRVIVR